MGIRTADKSRHGPRGRTSSCPTLAPPAEAIEIRGRCCCCPLTTAERCHVRGAGRAGEQRLSGQRRGRRRTWRGSLLRQPSSSAFGDTLQQLAGMQGLGNGISPRKPAEQRRSPSRFPRENIRERSIPGLEPCSACWETNALHATPPWLKNTQTNSLSSVLEEMFKMLSSRTNTCISPPLHGNLDALMNLWKISDCFAACHNEVTEGARSVTWGCIHNKAKVVTYLGATVDERLARSPPTKANRAQPSVGSPDLSKSESCRTMQVVGGFSRGSPVPPPFNSDTAPNSLQSPSSTLNTSLSRAAQISSLTHSQSLCPGLGSRLRLEKTNIGLVHVDYAFIWADILRALQAKSGKSGESAVIAHSPKQLPVPASHIPFFLATYLPFTIHTSHSSPSPFHSSSTTICLQYTTLTTPLPQNNTPHRQPPHHLINTHTNLNLSIAPCSTTKVPLAACLPGCSPIFTEKRRSRKGHTGTRYKNAIATTRRALNWRASMRMKRGEYGAAPELKGGGETGDPRDNPPTGGIVRHDSHLLISWTDPARN
ncbi:hypothetical protein PR048_016264 [Dryococelus australis]|uniref:Uncharacterized protein n=1 Tax=Dryococelus australis TaxID=614101 RepID=A0ABQ9HJJ7_9NEOP|nr:hypothetical protein PR048_016264 [Dryococelus australis]